MIKAEDTAAEGLKAERRGEGNCVGQATSDGSGERTNFVAPGSSAELVPQGDFVIVIKKSQLLGEAAPGGMATDGPLQNPPKVPGANYKNALANHTLKFQGKSKSGTLAQWASKALIAKQLPSAPELALPQSIEEAAEEKFKKSSPATRQKLVEKKA